MSPRSLLLLAAGLSACSLGAEADFTSLDTAGEVAPPAGALRIDVVPPAMDPKLLPQSQVVNPQTSGALADEYTSLAITLKPTILVSGSLTASVSTPWQGLTTAPTEVEPLAAAIRAWQPGTLQDASATSDQTGFFQLELVADRQYDLAIVPTDATVTPFVVSDQESFRNDRDLTQLLPEGAPIWGRVQDRSGTPLVGVPMHIRRSDSPVDARSATFTSDSRGWFLARVLAPGDYVVEVEGGRTGAGIVVPGVSASVKVLDEDGATTLVDVGDLSGNTLLTGSVMDANGQDVIEATVELEATSLDGCEACNLTVETTTDPHGLFIARLLPGNYELTIIPKAVAGGVSASPFRAPVHLEPGVTTTLDEIALSGSSTLSGTVTGSDGRPAKDVQVTATQADFGHQIFNTTTDGDGHFSVEVPTCAYDLALTPPTGSEQGAITHVEVNPGEPLTLSLAAGQPVSGTVSFDGAGVPYALVEVRDYATNQLLGSTISGGDGTFALVIDAPEATPTEDGDSGGGDTATGGGDTSGDTGDTSGGSDTASDTADTTADSGDTSARDTSSDTGDTSAGDTSAGDTSAGDTSAGDTSTGDTASGPPPRPTGTWQDQLLRRLARWLDR